MRIGKVACVHPANMSGSRGCLTLLRVRNGLVHDSGHQAVTIVAGTKGLPTTVSTAAGDHAPALSNGANVVTRIVVFGAGGRAGRRVVAEAVARGHEVTAVVRDPAGYQDLAGEGVLLVSGDVTEAGSVSTVAAGHDVAVNAAGRLDIPAHDFYLSATRALLDGLARAGVGRLLAIGIGSTLETAPGVRVYDGPDFPAEFRAFSLGHAAQLDALRAADTGIDWLVIAPPPTMLDNEAPRTGRYRVGDNRVLATDEGAALFSYADLAVALVDEIETPKHHRALIAVAP
jgi:putative NADH-flavin reductase